MTFRKIIALLPDGTPKETETHPTRPDYVRWDDDLVPNGWAWRHRESLVMKGEVISWHEEIDTAKA